jgi:hypothetical protein
MNELPCINDMQTRVTDKRTVRNHAGLIIEDIMTKALSIYKDACSKG